MTEKHQMKAPLCGFSGAGGSLYDEPIRFFTEETGVLACMSVACGTADRTVRAFGGTADPDGRPVREDSIFDLASLTKLFTGLMLMRLFE